MDPPPLRQRTSATVQVVPQFDDRDGSLLATVLIKERFWLNDALRLERVGDATIHVADEPWDPKEPATSSIRYPSDLCVRKPSTDVVVVGAAVAPHGREVRELDVMLRVARRDKRLRVFGPRSWGRSLLGTMQLSDPAPFERTPLRWENAWGGSDYETDPERPLEEPRNPSGRGLAREPSELEGEIGPSVEDPEDLISSATSRPRPMGLGAIGRHWVPRRDYSGTFDEEWMQERMPLMPMDFDDRFHQAAPPDQVMAAPLQGGERIEVHGMHEKGPIALELPALRFFVGLQTADRLSEHRPQLDTVVLEPNHRQLTMTWRSNVPLPRRATLVRFVQVHEKRMLT